MNTVTKSFANPFMTGFLICTRDFLSKNFLTTLGNKRADPMLKEMKQDNCLLVLLSIRGKLNWL